MMTPQSIAALFRAHLKHEGIVLCRRADRRAEVRNSDQILDELAELATEVRDLDFSNEETTSEVTEEVILLSKKSRDLNP